LRISTVFDAATEPSGNDASDRFDGFRRSVFNE
jgi:hypothetical protein